MSRSEHLSGERILDWLDGRLGPSAAARIEVHLEDCSRCGAEVEGWRALLGELSQLGPLALRPGFRGRVLDEVARAALAQLPLAARVRGSLDHWMRRLRAFGAGHPQPARLQQFAEGALAHLPAAAVRRHLARCASCRTEARRWTALMRALGELPRLAPSPDFAPAVLRAVRLAPAPAASRARRLLGRARTLVALSPRRAWAAAWGFALTPAVTAGLIAYAIFSHPLVTVGNLAAFLWLEGSEWAGALVRALGSALVESASVLPAWGAVDALSRSPSAVGAALLGVCALTLASAWVLYRNVIAPVEAARARR